MKGLEIPIGEDHLEFFKKNRGTPIRSKYRGVTFGYYHNDKDKPCWITRSQVGGKFVWIGRFEFSEKGEKQARHAYSKFLFENNLKERTAKKKPYDKK